MHFVQLITIYSDAKSRLEKIKSEAISQLVVMAHMLRNPHITSAIELSRTHSM